MNSLMKSVSFFIKCIKVIVAIAEVFFVSVLCTIPLASAIRIQGHIFLKILSEFGAFIVLLFFLLWVRKKCISLSLTEVRKIKLLSLFFGVSIVTIIKMIMNWFFYYKGILSETETIQNQLNRIGNENFMLIVIGAHLIAPILEEVLFRGILLEWLCKKISLPKSLSVIVTAFVFALAHTYSFTPNLLPHFISGLFLGIVYNYSRSLMYAMIAHAMLNLSVTILYVFVTVV